MTLPPKYTDSELQYILELDPQLPDNLNEQHFLNEIRDNTKIKWRVNHFLFKKKLLLLLLDTMTVRKWRIFKSLNWLIALFIVGFTFWSGGYKILLFLILFPILIITFDHWIFIFNMTVLIGLKFAFKLNIHNFWIFVTTVTIGYLLNKAIDEMIEKKILRLALNDWATFWKYYSNKMIWMDVSVLNNEYKILTEKYPELRTL